MKADAAARSGLGIGIVQLAQAVEDLLVLVGQLLERPLVVVEPVGQDDADDPPLLVLEQVVQAVGPAGELAAHQVHDVGQRPGPVGGQELDLEGLVLVHAQPMVEDRVEVEPAEVDDDEAALGLVPGAARAGPQPAHGQVAAAPGADLLIEDLQVIGINASPVGGLVLAAAGRSG